MPSRIWVPLRRLHDVITELGQVVGAVALLLMLCSYIYEIVSRYFFNAPTRWSSVVVSHLLLAVVFSFLPVATRAIAHVRVNMLEEFSPRHGRSLRLLANVSGVVVCALAAWISLTENIRQYVNFIEVEGMVNFPKWWTSSFLTYGFASSAIWFLRSLADDWESRGVSRAEAP